jgi:hypothetical protein
MKVVRIAGLAVLLFALATMVIFPGPPAAGQSVSEVPPQGNGNFAYPAQGTTPYYSGLYKASGPDAEMVNLFNEETKAEREAAGLMKDYARTNKEEQRDKIKGKLSEVLGKEFDLQQKRRDLELARLEAQVKKLRDLMKKRNEARQTIVEKRLDQLIREAEGLGWTAPSGPGFPKANFFYNHPQPAAR